MCLTRIINAGVKKTLYTAADEPGACAAEWRTCPLSGKIWAQNGFAESPHARLSSKTLPFSSSAITPAGTSNREDQEICPENRWKQLAPEPALRKERK
jgi:hypothetical protein